MVSLSLGAREGATVQFYIKKGLHLGLRGGLTVPLALPLYPPLRMSLSVNQEHSLLYTYINILPPLLFYM